MKRRVAVVLAFLALVAFGGGCANDDADSQGTPQLLTVAPATSGAPTATTARSVVATTSIPSAPTAAATSAPVTAAATQPTGVPGGTSGIAMCRHYAHVVGTQSVLTIAGAFGGLDPVALARLELIAAPAVVEAADAMGAEWPAELDAERPAVTAGVTGPIAARANVAMAALTDAGITDTAALVTAWLGVLATYDPANPTVTVAGLPSVTEAALGAAATAYAAAHTRYDLDPSVLRTASTPLTTAYLFSECPELSYLITGDAD